MDLRYDGGKRDVPPPAGSIAVLPAGRSVLWRRRGRVDALHILLEPSLVARVAAESFEFDSTRTVVPPLDGLTVRELRSAIVPPNIKLNLEGKDIIAERAGDSIGA